MNKNEKFCQSCGMPMEQGSELYGTEADGTKSADYCSYCYEKGAFTFKGSMAEMIEICVPPVVQANPQMTADNARAMMNEFFPALKRWKTVSGGARLVKFEIKEIPALIFVGKLIRVNIKEMMKGNNPIEGFWQQCLDDGTFETLQKLATPYCPDYAGYMADWQNGQTFAYAAGMLFASFKNESIPAGFVSYTIEPSAVAVGWVRGTDIKDICIKEHDFVLTAAKEQSYTGEKAAWTMEVYNEARYNKPDSDGNITVDYWLPVEKNSQ